MEAICSIIFFPLLFRVVGWEVVAKGLRALVWGRGLRREIDIGERFGWKNRHWWHLVEVEVCGRGEWCTRGSEGGHWTWGSLPPRWAGFGRHRVGPSHHGSFDKIITTSSIGDLDAAIHAELADDLPAFLPYLVLVYFRLHLLSTKCLSLFRCSLVISSTPFTVILVEGNDSRLNFVKGASHWMPSSPILLPSTLQPTYPNPALPAWKSRCWRESWLPRCSARTFPSTASSGFGISSGAWRPHLRFCCHLHRPCLTKTQCAKILPTALAKGPHPPFGDVV